MRKLSWAVVLHIRKRVGDEVPEDKIDKIFLLSNKEINNKFQELVSDIPMEYVELGRENYNLCKRHN